MSERAGVDERAPLHERAGGVTIRLEHAGKTFDDGTRALEPVDLEIRAGETLVFLGPSGCGKTTTLRLVAGLDEPDPGGKVWFDTDDVTAVPIEKRNVGMVFQSYALFPNMSVEDNVAYGLKVRRVDPAERNRRVADMLQMMHIGELAHRRVDQLSGGQRQRVALARAIAPRPRVLLLDEPLTALDAKLRETLRVEIDRLLRSLAITTIYVTHDQAEAMALGDRIAVMQKGRIAQIGTPREIYQRPSNAFVAGFIGAMNRVAVSLDNGYLIGAGTRIRWSSTNAGAEILFRPEDVNIHDDETSPPQMEGRIVSAFFLGDHTRLSVDLGAGEPITVRTEARRSFAAGDTVRLSLSDQSILWPEG
jgi:putative spermidine/putrescine transport system ATP-binding protein